MASQIVIPQAFCIPLEAIKTLLGNQAVAYEINSKGETVAHVCFEPGLACSQFIAATGLTVITRFGQEAYDIERRQRDRDAPY